MSSEIKMLIGFFLGFVLAGLWRGYRARLR